MLDPGLGRFDHVVAMDSLIHYRAADIARALAVLGARTDGSVLFTVAPRTALLTVMHAAGKLFPRGDRSPAIVPVTEGGLRRRIASEPALDGFAWARSHRINSGFYLSNAIALIARPVPLPRRGGRGPGGARGAIMTAASQKLTRALMRLGPAILPFADAATVELPLGACCASPCSRSPSAWRRCC